MTVPARPSVILRCDPSAVIAAMSEATRLVEQFLDRALKIGQLFLRLPNGGIEVAPADNDSALRTGEVVVRLKVSDRFLELLTALRTGDIDLERI
jgi:hypothetical protein